ncbi:hypothetical protein EV401DRAFT_2201663 [Pisolithus croceorrhizus]|nr:hypothetical protein EV401DRAFT_2201663 [Pisolithus croceorrhizus]
MHWLLAILYLHGKNVLLGRFYPHWGAGLRLTYAYYMDYSEDGLTTKFMVAAVWVLDTLHISFMCHMLYYYLITNWGILTSLDYIVWSYPASILVTSFVIAIVQCFFVHKVYHLCRSQLKWFVMAPIMLLVLAQLGFNLAIVVVMLVNNTTTNALRTRFYTVTPTVSVVALAEVLIAVSLCILLYDGGSHSAVARMKRLLHTLIIYAINRCLLTLVVGIAQLTTDTDNMFAWTMGLDFVVSKLYANSLLASLNIRQHLRFQASGPGSDPCMNVIDFANLPKDVKGSHDGVIGISAVPDLDRTAALRREGGL